ncbi:MAG: hypothetical protein RBS26_08210 [Sulfuricurvum sp.]|jgi:hypothetical protein|nr:hypothetical protein [Sulfuricurvum sp.]
MDIAPLLERLRAVSNDDLRASLQTQNLSIDDIKFQTAFQCVAASHDLSRSDIDFCGPPDVPVQVIRGGHLRASVVFMIFSTLCYMRSEHLERGLDDIAEDSLLRAFRDIYRAGSIKRGEDTLVQHIRNALTHGTFQLGQSPEITFIDREWQEILVLDQIMELCEHVHRLYHEAFSDAVPRPPHWAKYGQT